MEKTDNTENLTAFGTFYPYSMIGEWKPDCTEYYWSTKIPQFFKILGFRKSEYGVHVFIDCRSYDEVPFFVIDLSIYHFADFVKQAYEKMLVDIREENRRIRKVALDALKEKDLVFVMPDGFSESFSRPFHGTFLKHSTYDSVDVIHPIGKVINVHRDQIRLANVPNEL